MVRKEPPLGIQFREAPISELSVSSTTSLYLDLLWTRFPKHLLVNKSRNLQEANKGQTNHSGLSNVIENQISKPLDSFQFPLEYTQSVSLEEERELPAW